MVVSKKKEVKVTPLMRQYNEIKSKYPNAILLFRVGDFYETFGEDEPSAWKHLRFRDHLTGTNQDCFVFYTND